MMNRKVIQIDKVSMEIVTYGKPFEGSSSDTVIHDVIIIVTGNPGVPSFYEEFAHQIYRNIHEEIPICIIGHSGHSKLPTESYQNYSCKREKPLYGLQDNLNHKVEFIRNFVPSNANIHVIGHSIGSWFILNLLRYEDIADKVYMCYLLFPTIERMAESPNGQFFVSRMLKITSILIFCSWLFNLLPNILQLYLIKIFCLFFGIQQNCLRAIHQMIHPVSLKNIFHLAKEEMIFVKQLDDNLITQYKQKLFFYYGSKDNWVPISYYKNLQTKYPDIDAKLCNQGIQHAFVLNNSIEMGKIVGDLIRQSISGRSK